MFDNAWALDTIVQNGNERLLGIIQCVDVSFTHEYIKSGEDNCLKEATSKINSHGEMSANHREFQPALEH